MNGIDTVNNVYNDLSVTSKNGKKDGDQELGQSAFLELMITQMENQSPLDPQDNTQFISQLAQFSSVESLDKLNKNFDAFSSNFVANQALQASTLVGRSVTVPTDTTALEHGGVVNLSADIPASSSNVNVNIYSENGELVDSIPLGAQRAGSLVLRWDGMSAEQDGELIDWKSAHEEGVTAGNYTFEVTASIDGEDTAIDTSLSANVNSVTVGPNGALSLNLAGIGSVSLADVKQFNE